MSDAALGALLEKQIIPIVASSAGGGKGGHRFDVETYPGQVFRFDWKTHVNVLLRMHKAGQFLNDPNSKKALTENEIKAHLKKIFDNYKEKEEANVVGYTRELASFQDGKPVRVTVTKERFKELKAIAKKETRYWTAVVRNYRKVQEFTTPSKFQSTHNLNRQLNELDNKISGKNIDFKDKSQAGRFNFEQEVGHGFGKGLASSGFAAGRATGKLQQVAAKNRIVKDILEKDEIKSRLYKLNRKFGVDLEHAFKLADNDFAKDYVLVLTTQDKASNRIDAIDEKRLLSDLQKLFEEIVLEVKASPSLRDSFEEQIFSYFEGNKHLKVSGKKSKKRFSANNQAKKTTKVTTNEAVPIITGGVKIQTNKIRRQSKRTRNPKPVSPLGLLMLLNKKLPQKIQQKMGLPGLVNRTGRFASSVQAVNVTDDAQGIPSIAYTYQKNPYQIFETSTGQRPWSTLERDPRTLIDESIRELAAEMALGRFTTRRV